MLTIKKKLKMSNRRPTRGECTRAGYDLQSCRTGGGNSQTFCSNAGWRLRQCRYDSGAGSASGGGSSSTGTRPPPFNPEPPQYNPNYLYEDDNGNLHTYQEIADLEDLSTYIEDNFSGATAEELLLRYYGPPPPPESDTQLLDRLNREQPPPAGFQWIVDQTSLPGRTYAYLVPIDPNTQICAPQA